MMTFFEISGLILIILMALIFVRAMIGPTVIDRLVAVNVIGTKSTVLIIIMGIIFERLDMFVDIAIAYGLLNFIASIGAAKYFDHQSSLDVEAAKGDKS